jgi:hypothetical protein
MPSAAIEDPDILRRNNHSKQATTHRPDAFRTMPKEHCAGKWAVAASRNVVVFG